MTTALSVETPVAPPPTRNIPTPGQLAADNARKHAREQSTNGDPVPTWVDVNPAMAEAWLKEFNPKTQRQSDDGRDEQQRNLRREDVEKYARIMVRDEWEQTGDPIQFGKSGILLNGQHRLSAVVKARKTVRLLIMTDVEDAARYQMDSGVRRTIGDKLAMKGRKYTMHQSSVARLLWDLQNGTSRKPDKPSDTELMSLVEEDPVLEWVVTEVMPHLPVIGSKTVSAYCYMIFHKKDPAAAAEFFERLKTLTNLPDGSPIAALSARLRTFKAGSFKERAQGVSMTVITWNAWRSDETRERIQAKRNAEGYYEIPEVQ